MTQAEPQEKHQDQKGILIVDDHPLMRRGLAGLIETDPRLRVCGEAATRQDALDAISALRPDLVIVDLSLKDSDGLELIKDIKSRHAQLPVLVVSMHDESIYAERTIRAGALGYVTKQEMDDTVLTAISRVFSGEVYISDKLNAHFARKYIGNHKPQKDSPLEVLSDRELEVFRLIGQGNGTRKIAGRLHISIKTVESHKENLKSKLKLKTGEELTQFATRWVETGQTS